MDKKEAFKIVLDELTKCTLYTGTYDAKHGSKDFMWGVSAVMESIAFEISDDIGDAFSSMFAENMIKSENKVTKKSDLEIAKDIITKWINDARCGIFNSRNLVGDTMCNLYDSDTLTIDICFNWAYFEVFGLSNDDYEELEKYYKTLLTS